MTRDKDYFEEYPVLSEIKLSANEREDIWHSIEQGMERSHIDKVKRGITMIKTSAAVAAALALCAAGIGYTLHHAGPNTTPGVTTASHSQVPTATTQPNFSSEIALIKHKGYSVTTEKPNASVQTASGKTLSAWICTLSASQDGHNLRVLFFLNGKYVGTDAHASLEITSAMAAGHGIAVTYPVYKANDSLANPTGTPVTITYTWNGSKLAPNKPYPKQFQTSSTTTQSQNPISTKTYSTSIEAANQIAAIQGGKLGGVPVQLGKGITADASGAMGHARYEWKEGNWAIEVRYFTNNRGVKQVAEGIVSYLHTHMLPAPNSRGVIIVNSTSTSETFKAKTTIAWQEDTRVHELQQSGNPIQALQTVVKYK